MSDTPTVVPFNGKPDEMLGALENIKRNMATLTEYHEVNAKLLYARYTSLIAAGFTADQALLLVRG